MYKATPPVTRHTECNVERSVQVAVSVASEKLQKLSSPTRHIFRADQGIDVVRSLWNAVDRVEELSFRDTRCELQEVID
jgi:hypothetical protein